MQNDKDKLNVKIQGVCPGNCRFFWLYSNQFKIRKHTETGSAAPSTDYGGKTWGAGIMQDTFHSR